MVFSSDSKIFKNESILSFDYLPEILPHRENQIKFLASNLSLVGEGRKSQNIFIFGASGIGKTASVKYVFRKFSEEFPNVKTVYLNCWDYNTSAAVLSEITISLGAVVQRRGWAKDEIISRLKEVLNRNKKSLIVCLDEADQLIRKDQETLYDLSRINQYVQNPVAIILISNDKSSLAKLEPRTYSTLAAEDIEFKPYTLGEMKDIMQERVDYAFGSVENGVVALAANHAMQKGGDVRIGLQCLLKAGRIAEKENTNKLKVEHVKKILRDVNEIKPSIVESKLNENEKVLYEILSTKKIWQSGDLYRKYAESSPDAVSQRMFENYLDHLEELNMIKFGEKTVNGNIRLVSKV